MIEPNIYGPAFGSGKTGIFQAILEASGILPGAPTPADTIRKATEYVTRDPGGTSGRIFRILYPQKYARLRDAILDRNEKELRRRIANAALTGDQAALSAIQQTFTEEMRTGGRFGMSMNTRLVTNMGWSAIRMGGRAGVGIVRGANIASKAVLGASLGQVGFAAAVVGGIGYGVGNMLGITGPQAAQIASTVHETFKQANRPTYGHSEIGQSTQGLVFGLHARRTA